MKLIECYIENFGKLSDFKYSFSDGLNTVKQDNGYGKTTLTVFIKAMLYGLDDTRKVKLETNDRKHYMPWNGGRCAGQLTFESNGKKYRIERCFMPKAADDTFAIYDLKTGKPSGDFSAAVGEELFGIDQDGFERTVFLSEANLSGKNENKSISAKLSDLVGSDGDIGAMDDAIELLEKQRKAYKKRGGAGEIGEVKKRAYELDSKIRELEKMEAELVLEKNDLSAVNGKLRGLYEKRRECEEKNRALSAERLKRNYEKQYLSMKDAVTEEEKTLARLSEFFASGVPTQSEIENARELASTARITLEQSASEDDGELYELREFFKSGVSEQRIKEADEKSALALSLRADEERARWEAKQRESRLSELPSCSPSDIDSLVKEVTASKNVNKSWRILIPLGIITAVLIVGIFLLVIGLKSYHRDKESLSLDEAKEKAVSLVGDGSIAHASSKDSLIEMLYAERARAEKAEEIKSEIKILNESAMALSEKADSALRFIYEFLSEFPMTDAKSPSEAVSEISRKYSLYKALSQNRAAIDKRREEQLIAARQNAARASEFVSRFPTVTERTFDEISARLIEYTAAQRSLLRMRESLDEFAREHKIDTGALTLENSETNTEPIDTEELSAKILETERERALVERKIKSISDELEAKEELVSERDELISLADKYEKSLNIVLKTKSYLEEAKDNLTSRYLSGTKAAFDKYVSLIGLESGEDFTMDTSFTVMKNERGTLRQTEAYSRGTRELYALSARLALVDSLYEKEMPFIILDDPFAYFDDDKLTRALSAIKAAAKEKQIIYLTCADSRKI